MKKKGNFRKVVSGLLAGMTMLSTVLSPMTAYAAEIRPEEKPPLYEEVKDLLDEDEVVTAKDYEIETGSVFDVKSDYTGLEIKDDNKVKVTFEEAKNKKNEDFTTDHADTYKAVYYVEPVNQEHPKYQISRNLIVREKETEVQTEAAGSEAVTESETAGSEQQTEEAEDSEAESEITDIDADEFDDLVEQAQNQDTYDEESGLELHDVLEQAGDEGVDLEAMEEGEIATFEAVSAYSARSTQQVTIEKGPLYRYADYNLGTYLTEPYYISYGSVRAIAYCVQPAKPGPGSGNYTITKIGDNQALAKVCYYGTDAAGSESFFANKHTDFSEGKRFIIIHMAASYANGSSDRMYWLERLKKLPEAPILPQDGRAADKCENTYEFYRFQKHINQSDWKRIKEIAGEYGVTVSSVLIGIYAEVISRWSSNKHFTLNLPIQNRPTIGNNTNSIVGDFTAVNLLEVNVTQNMSFIERVKEITKRLMEDLEHNSFSGVEVLRELSKVSEEKELLMPIVFTGVLKTDGTVGTIEYGFSHTPQVWIDCQIVDEIDSEDQEKGLMISWDTRKGAIKESIVTEMFESFTETIRILGIKHSEEWKNPLEIIVPSASKKKVICERNKGITNQSRIQQRFVKYAKKNSNKTAVIDAVETVTYGELLERAEYIAGYLRKEFVENRTGLVAIRMKKSVNQIAAVMGVLIAGFSYLPIDIKQPLARQEKILSKANVIVELDEKKVNMILQNLEYRLEKHPEFQNPIAYVIFTSGSTGEPKGVVMSHTAAQNTLISIENMYNISEEDTILGIAELSFDLSVFDIFSVLGVGGTLVLPNPEKGPDASHWGRLLNEYKVTLWNSVPAQAEMLDAFASKSESYPTVRLVLLSGDWINTSLPGRLRKIMTNAQMISLGGATEGGIWSIYHEIDEIEERPTILYGKALLGQWMGVVDEELRICPEYVSGQIAIGGYSLAEGYLGDTTLTKEKFVYVEEEKNRIYLTGDNGRYVENGDIEFLGRLDNQVKINGHRIEIAEIENAIRGMQNIEDCCVVYNQSIGKGVLIAFIKNKISSISYTKEEYRKQLAFFLPPAMIPSEFVNVERFPLSTNGKIDRKGLAESIQKNIKVKHNAKATLISQKKEYVELAKSIKKIVCSISGNDYIDYEDNLLENGLDSLLLSQISGRIVSDIQEAQGMRFDEILRASLTMPTIMGIAQYISDCKNPSKNQMHSNAGNQTRNSYTVVYIFGDNENEIRDVLIEKLSASNISCKRVGGQEIIERCHEDISVKKKYIIAFSEMASLCITKASELLGENIIINRIFLINPSKAKESDLYLGDISIIDGNSVAIKSWEKAVLGNVREFESNSNDIFDIIMRELENDK